MYNTRLNCSSNGDIHLGHVYMGVVNEAAAHESGGNFIARWDDSHEIRLATMGRERITRIRAEQEFDLKWIGLQPDLFVNQSDIIDEVHDYIGKHSPGVLPDENPPIVPEFLGDDRVMLYPLTPMLTIEKVVMDHMAGVNLLIRGVDLLSEYSLYQYYCRLLDFPQPRHIYLPRLRWASGDMSKSGGAQTVSNLRSNGYTPEQVRGMVEAACLRNPPNGWTLQNLKGAPTLCT